MKRFLFAAILAVGLASTACASGPVITDADAKVLVQKGAVLVDVRTPEEFADGHAEGARNIPVSEITSRAGEIPRDHPVVVYCASGARSAQAASTLARMGYSVRNLGTLDAWRH